MSVLVAIYCDKVAFDRRFGQYKRFKVAPPVWYFDTDTLLLFEMRAAQRRVGLKLKFEFCTYWPLLASFENSVLATDFTAHLKRF